MTHHGISDERFALRAALRNISPRTYVSHGLGRGSSRGNDVALVPIRCVKAPDGRLEAVGRSQEQGPLVIDAGIRLHFIRPRFGWDFAEYGRDLDVFEVLDGPLTGRFVDFAQPIGAFRVDQELVSWLLVPVDSPVATQPNLRHAVLKTISSLYPEVRIAESETAARDPGRF